MTDLDVIKGLDEKTRQIVGLYAIENARADKLRRTMESIDAWAKSALNHTPPFGNDYRRVLSCIQREARAAFKTEGETK